MTNPTWAGRSATPPTPEGESQRAGWIPVVGVIAALGLVGAGGYLLGSSDEPAEATAAPTTTVEIATTDEDTPGRPVEPDDGDASNESSGDDSAAENNPVEDGPAQDDASESSNLDGSADDGNGAGQDSATGDSATGDGDTDEPTDGDSASDNNAADNSAADTRTDGDTAESAVTENQVILDEGQVRGALLRDGVLYLGGAVPSEEVGNQIIERAEAVVGEGNVVSEYVIDPDAEMGQGAPLYIDDVVLFAYGANTYDPQFEPLLDLGLALLSQNPSVTVTIITHTDASGSASFNDHLSYQRGQSVAQYWVDRGIPVEQIRIDARGEREPRADDHTDEGAQLNRRAEFFIEGLLP